MAEHVRSQIPVRDVPDDVSARRARLRRISSLGQRIGYGLYLGALVGGVIGIRTSYTPLLSTLVALALIVGSMLLAPTIVMSYGIKAAEREERQAAAAAQGAVTAQAAAADEPLTK